MRKLIAYLSRITGRKVHPDEIELAPEPIVIKLSYADLRIIAEREKTKREVI